jgi:hypothetical protein
MLKIYVNYVAGEIYGSKRLQGKEEVGFTKRLL